MHNERKRRLQTLFIILKSLWTVKRYGVPHALDNPHADHFLNNFLPVLLRFLVLDPCISNNDEVVLPKELV